LAGKSALVKANTNDESVGHEMANADPAQQKGDYQKVRANTEEDEDIEDSLNINLK